MEMIFESSSCYLFVQFASCCGEFKLKNKKKNQKLILTQMFLKKRKNLKDKKNIFNE